MVMERANPRVARQNQADDGEYHHHGDDDDKDSLEHGLTPELFVPGHCTAIP